MLWCVEWPWHEMVCNSHCHPGLSRLRSQATQHRLLVDFGIGVVRASLCHAVMSVSAILGALLCGEQLSPSAGAIRSVWEAADLSISNQSAVRLPANMQQTAVAVAVARVHHVVKTDDRIFELGLGLDCLTTTTFTWLSVSNSFK